MKLKALALIVGAALYAICPLDGDWIPVIGWIDDAFVVWFSAKKAWGLLKGR